MTDLYVSHNSDASNARTLSGGQVSVMGGPYNNSVENCVTACTEANYTLAGVEFATQCCTYYTLSLSDEILFKLCSSRVWQYYSEWWSGVRFKPLQFGLLWE